MPIRIRGAPGVARPAPYLSLTAALVGALTLTTVLAAPPAAAQRDGSSRTSLELRPVVGAFIATGSEHRGFVKDGVLVGGQASWAFSPQVAVVGNFAWSPTDRPAWFGFPRERGLDVYQYDVGLEGRTGRPREGVGGFAGLGLGGRTYRLENIGTTTQFDGYGALGGDYLFGRTAIRVEGRDYLSRFRPIVRGNSKTRNDVTVTAGVTFRL